MTVVQLRELALKEVALRVEKKVENEVVNTAQLHGRILAVIDSSEKRARKVIRKTARMATHLNAGFTVLYVQSDREAPDRIPLARQRYLINNFNLAQELGGEVMRVHSNRHIDTIVEACIDRKISNVCISKPEFSLYSLIVTAIRLRFLLNRLSRLNIDLTILS